MEPAGCWGVRLVQTHSCSSESYISNSTSRLPCEIPFRLRLWCYLCLSRPTRHQHQVQPSSPDACCCVLVRLQHRPQGNHPSRAWSPPASRQGPATRGEPGTGFPPAWQDLPLPRARVRTRTRPLVLWGWSPFLKGSYCTEEPMMTTINGVSSLNR